jgi:hypothetical protein
MEGGGSSRHSYVAEATSRSIRPLDGLRSSGGDGSRGTSTTSAGSGTEKGKGGKEKEKGKGKEKENGIGKEESEESIRREIQRLEGLLPPPGGGNAGPAPNLGPFPASQAERKQGKGEVHGRTDTLLDEKLEVRPFLMQAFGSHVDSFLDIQVPRLDVPFVYVTLTVTTPW